MSFSVSLRDTLFEYCGKGLNGIFANRPNLLNLKFLRSIKYWPPVARVDNVYGDKNLFCTCPSIDEYKDSAA